MWYSVESTICPETVDSASSKRYVYARRNIEEKSRTDEITGENQTIYTFEETKIPRDVYDIFKQSSDNDERITDVEVALTEIYEEMIT